MKKVLIKLDYLARRWEKHKEHSICILNLRQKIHRFQGRQPHIKLHPAIFQERGEGASREIDKNANEIHPYLRQFRHVTNKNIQFAKFCELLDFLFSLVPVCKKKTIAVLTLRSVILQQIG